MKYGILEGHEAKVIGDPLLENLEIFSIKNRRVAFDTVNGSDVSTVFLGIDHGYETPLWFETMVFGGHLDGEQDRYTTWDKAELGHKKMVERVQQAKEPSSTESE